MRELKRALGGYGVGVVPIFIVPGPPRLSCNYLKTLLIERFSALAGRPGRQFLDWSIRPRLFRPGIFWSGLIVNLCGCAIPRIGAGARSRLPFSWIGSDP
jgi:hypothetical protein